MKVVAAALFDAQGRVLLAQRPAGKHMAGRWEFPGGKLDAGESEQAGLVRELAEELGIRVLDAAPCMRLVHEYAERAVELCFWHVSAWEGTVQPLDAQQLAWVEPARLTDWDILEADRPFVDLLGGVIVNARQGAHYAVRNPRTGEADHHFVAPSAAEVSADIARLRAAQPAWAERSLERRIDMLQRWRVAYLAALPDIVAALSLDTGRHLIATGEGHTIAAAIDRWCRMVPALATDAIQRSAVFPSISYRAQYVPHALVGVISPWNFPLSLAFIDAIPALLAGAAVYIKPSEVTPRWTIPVRRSIAAVPELAAVLHLEAGGAEAGEALVAGSDSVCFTGSVKTGRIVAQNAARHFVPAFLELGGKDPIVVTATADLERAAQIVLRASCSATGQACQSIERVYVDRRVAAPFVERLVAKAREIAINWPDIHRGTLGPFIWGPQAAIVEEQIRDAVAKGARVLSGGEIIDHGGKWLQPTVLVDVDHTMKVMTEETFGPVMPVVAYDTIDEAVALANDGVFGLSGAVLAGTIEEAELIGRRLDVGAVSLNDGALTAMVHEAEKNSFKLSGMGGSRMGPAGYLRFFRKKALIRQEGAAAGIEALAEENAAG